MVTRNLRTLIIPRLQPLPLPDAVLRVEGPQNVPQAMLRLFPRHSPQPEQDSTAVFTKSGGIREIKKLYPFFRPTVWVRYLFPTYAYTYHTVLIEFSDVADQWSIYCKMRTRGITTWIMDPS